ncbi:MAG: hypothetical protein NTY32_01250, partial [Bacteroidia bacterium]|nr:hypothetical protein [Bacteroidia bacterium]
MEKTILFENNLHLSRMIHKMNSRRLYVLLFLMVSSIGSVFSIQVTSTPKSEIAEGQWYNYKLQVDKTLPAGSFTVVEKPV